MFADRAEYKQDCFLAGFPCSLPRTFGLQFLGIPYYPIPKARSRKAFMKAYLGLIMEWEWYKRGYLRSL